MGRIIEINPGTRAEGEIKITIILDEKGNAKDAYFQILTFGGFEAFMIGRPAEEAPRIATRICGVCPWAHHLCAAKAVDSLFGRAPTETAVKLRRLGYYAHMIDSHTIHFFILALPDFYPGLGENERNILGILRKNPELVKRLLKIRAYVREIEEIIGGKATHPVTAIPGGVSKRLTEDERRKIESYSKEILQFTMETWEFFRGIVEKTKFIEDTTYYLETYYVGLVGEDDALEFYDGPAKILAPDGEEVAKFMPEQYLDYIAEHVETWTYPKFPYLRIKGWKGFVDGKDSGIYRVGPLARINVAKKITTEKAEEAYRDMLSFFGKKPIHNSLAYHWSRVIEMIYSAEMINELITNPEITRDDTVNLEGNYRGKGIGFIEAPRGFLIHHYEADEKAIITKANHIVPTTMNNPAICLYVKRAARKLIREGKINKDLLRRVEMAFRCYDPCITCSVHSIGYPIVIEIFDSDGKLIAKLRR